MVLSYDDIRNLPLPNLSVQLLRSFGAEPNFNNVVQGYRNRDSSGDPQPADFEQLLARLSDAWAWLESHALTGFSSRNPQGQLVSRDYGRRRYREEFQRDRQGLGRRSSCR